MKSLQKVLKISARYAFKKLRSVSPYFCGALGEKVHVTRIFWNHINFAKERSLQDSLERLSMFPLLEIIIKRGTVVSSDEIFTKMCFEEFGVEFLIIILKDSYKHVLLSCFIRHNKKTLCLSPLGPQA